MRRCATLIRQRDELKRLFTEVRCTLEHVKCCGLCGNSTRAWRIATQLPMKRTARGGIVRIPRTDSHRTTVEETVPKSEAAVMRMTQRRLLESVSRSQPFITEHIEDARPLVRTQSLGRGGVVIANLRPVMMLNGNRTAPCPAAHAYGTRESMAAEQSRRVDNFLHRDAQVLIDLLIRRARPEPIEAEHHAVRSHPAIPRHWVRRFD
jgi:hypothetical protein